MTPLVSSARSAQPALAVSLLLLLTVVGGCVAVSGSASDRSASPGVGRAGDDGVSGNAGKQSPRGVAERPPGGSGARPAAAGPLYGAQLAAPPPLDDIRQDEGGSVPLPDGRTLYIFADTLHLHTPPTFFASSSAATTQPQAPLRLEYSVSRGGVPREFLPRTPAERAGQVDGVRYTAVWPTGAVNLPDGRTIISYAKYDMLLQPREQLTFLGAGLFEFRYPGAARFRDGAVARRIADDIWQPEDGAVGTPVYRKGHVYFTMCENLECYSVRTTPESLADRSSYRWKTATGWSRSPSDRVAMSFGESRPGHNPSVAWVPSLDAYVMADTVAGDISFDGMLWVAPDPWGPWSDPVKVPLPRCSSRGCYGLNVHPAHSTPRTLRISYSPVMVNRIGPFVYLIDQPIKVSPSGRRVSFPL